MALPSEEQNAVAQPVSGMDALQQERAKLYQIQAELMKQIEERSKPDPSAFWAAMARGFGNPATPSFAGGAAGFAGNLQAAQEEERKRAIETAQMRMQLAQAQLAMKRSDVIGQALFGEPPKQEPAASGAIDSVAQAAGFSPNVARAMPPDLKKAVMLQWIQGDEKGAIDTMAKFALENAKTPDQMKIQQWNISQFPPSLRPFIQQFIANNAIFGSAIDRTKAFTEIDKLVDDGVISSKQGDIYKNSLSPDILTKPIGTYSAPPAAPVAPSAPAAKPAATGAPAGFPRVSPEQQSQRDADKIKILNKELEQERQKLAAATTPDQRRTAEQNIASLEREMGVKPPVTQPTKRERELQSAEDIKRMEATVKRQSELEATWSDDAERAKDEIRDARTVHKVVGENSAGFGLLSKPGSALAYAAQAGFRIGDKSVGINELEQSLLRSGKFTQKEINAVSIVHQIALKWQLAVAATQKGAVSNYERTLFGQAGLNVSDDPKIIQYKASLIDAQAKNRQEIWQKYQEFKENNKRANIDDFKRSNTFLELQKQYDQKLDRIRDAYSK